MNYRERLKDKKRIVIKIGSSSLTHSETGRLNLRKLEVLARELSDLRNQGKDVILVSSGAIATGVAALGMHEKPTELKGKQACAFSQFRCDRRRQTVAWHDRAAAGTLYKTGMCSSRTGQTDDDLSETFF